MNSPRTYHLDEGSTAWNQPPPEMDQPQQAETIEHPPPLAPTLEIAKHWLCNETSTFITSIFIGSILVTF